MCFDERIQHALHELCDDPWDVLIFAETWRAESIEQFQTEYGHWWYSSGGTGRQNGVGFLLNRRWPQADFKPVSNRYAILDIHVQENVIIRAHGVYMPHGGLSDELVEEVYGSLT